MRPKVAKSGVAKLGEREAAKSAGRRREGDASATATRGGASKSWHADALDDAVIWQRDGVI